MTARPGTLQRLCFSKAAATFFRGVPGSHSVIAARSFHDENDSHQNSSEGLRAS